MSEHSSLSDSQRDTLALAPNGAFVVLLGADSANPLSMLREGRALAKTLKKSRKDGTYPPLVTALADHLVDHGDEVGAKMPSLESMDEAVEVGRGWLRDAASVAATLPADEREGYIRWVLDLTRAGAEAVKEKDSDHRVSPGEARALEEVEATLRAG